VTHKLLLADDSVTIQRVVELTFSGEDVQVITVGDGEQAIARIPIERPDIVLADIGMPKRSGYDVAAFVKGHPDLAHIPVLLLAGAFEPVDEARAREVKCDGVLVKPFEPQQVISRVRELVDGAKGKASQPVAVPVPPAVVPEPQFASPELRTWEPPKSYSEHRIPSPESRIPSPESRIPSPEHRIPNPESRIPDQEQPLDDYFERLDAAFAGLAGGKTEERPSLLPEIDEFRAADVPTVDRLLGSTSPSPAVASTVSPGGAVASDPAPARSGRNPIADIFTALFAVEQGEPGAAPVHLAAPQPAPVVVTEELVDAVTRRVLERLSPDTARELVGPIVSEVAERLIRDEITRIKTAVSSKQ
jgi:CheY-like chemotaxis protein